MKNKKIIVLPLFLMMILCLACSRSENPFQTLLEDCAKCEIEFEKYSDFKSCGYTNIKNNISVNNFFRNLKKIPFNICYNYGIGVTDDAGVFVFENNKTIFSLGIWLVNDRIIIFYGNEYYSTECDKMNFLFE